MTMCQVEKGKCSLIPKAICCIDSPQVCCKMPVMAHITATCCHIMQAPEESCFAMALTVRGTEHKCASFK